MGCLSNAFAIVAVDDAFLFSSANQPEPWIVPAYALLDPRNGRMLAYGDEARFEYRLHGPAAHRVRLTIDGVPRNCGAFRNLLHAEIHRQQGFFILFKPQVVVAARSFEEDMPTWVSTMLYAGAGQVRLTNVCYTSLLGLDLDADGRTTPRGSLVLSDDWYEFAMYYRGDLLTGVQDPGGTHAWVEDIRNHLLLARGAAPTPTDIASRLLAMGVAADASASHGGWGAPDSGRRDAPLAEAITREDLTVGMRPSFERMVGRIRGLLDGLPADLRSLARQATIEVTGSAIAVPGVAEWLAWALGQPVAPHAATVHPAIHGVRKVLDNPARYRSTRRAPAAVYRFPGTAGGPWSFPA